jgi:hypothetical protein
MDILFSVRAGCEAVDVAVTWEAVEVQDADDDGERGSSFSASAGSFFYFT